MDQIAVYKQHIHLVAGFVRLHITLSLMCLHKRAHQIIPLHDSARCLYNTFLLCLHTQLVMSNTQCVPSMCAIGKHSPPESEAGRAGQEWWQLCELQVVQHKEN